VSEDIAYRDLPRAQPYHPSTFIERGVAVPFTTPLLDGTRARPGARDSVELIVPTLSGGPGVYIVPSSGVRLFCRVTVHDARLNQKIASLSSVTPMTIRSAARAVAAEGLAGDEAMVAARAIDEADRCEQLLTNFQLLMALLDEVEPNRHAGLQDTGRYTHELEQYARRAVVDVAAKIGQPAETIAEVLEALAGILVAIGLRRQTVPARVPRLLQLLRRVSAEVADWSQLHVTEALQSYADVVCTVAGVTVSCAAATLQDAQALSDNVSDLMRRWTREPAEIARLAARPEWLLDGWERICLIWTIAADDAARRAALVEMAQLAPALPREAADWAPVPFGADTPLPLRRTVRLNEDWRTGATVFHLIARNEHLLALAA
jgi:hypothetical protein